MAPAWPRIGHRRCPGAAHIAYRVSWTLSCQVMVDAGLRAKEGLTMGFVKARGNSFYYEEQGGGQPILLIPPSGSTASTWGVLPNDLAGAGRVIAYDRRGYTRSGGQVIRSAAEHAADAAAILDALTAAPAVAVGTSAGATIALSLTVS